MLKRSLVFVFAVLMSLNVAAQETAAGWQCPEGYAGQTLDVFNWFDYIAEDTIANFEAACDVEVNYTEFDEESFVYDTLLLGNPGYDVVIATGAIIAPLIEQDLLIPLDYDLIPNAGNLSEDFSNRAVDPENVYSMPYGWGSMGLIYRLEAFPDGINSWQAVWDYSAPSIWIDDSRAMLGVALISLGYDPNTTDIGEVLLARDFLGEKGANILGIGTEEDVVNAFLAGEIDLAIAYSGTMANLLGQCECADFNYVIPEEGSNIFVDSLFVPVDADAEDLAMLFIDYSLDPVVNASLSNMGFGSVNQATQAAGFIDESFSEISGFNPTEELLARSFSALPLEEEIAAAYELAWDELRGFYGLEED